MEAREMLERMARLVYEIMEYGHLLTTEDRTLEWVDWDWRCQKTQVIEATQVALRELVDIETWQAKPAKERWLSVIAITELEL